MDFRWQFFEELPSTNTYMMERGRQGEPEGLVVLAGRQTSGRGRRGRSFASPGDAGLYLSLLLRPRAFTEDLGCVTMMAGLAGVKALDKALPSLAGQTQIKWVNDLFLHGGKVAGILAESGQSPKSDQSPEPFLVIGIGFNLWQDEAGEVQRANPKAATVLQTPPEDAAGRESLRLRLAEAFVEELGRLYEPFFGYAFLPEYKARCLVLGRRVKLQDPYHTGSARQDGTDSASEQTYWVEDIGPRGELLTRDEAGERHAFRNGEISVIIS